MLNHTDMLLAALVLTIAWGVWLYPFLFRAPHHQKRPSITLTNPTRRGLLLEVGAIAVAIAGHNPWDSSPGALRWGFSSILAIAASLLGWSAVRHLGRQFRVNAGLYEDHELVRTGAYAIVRHPIYSSLLAMLGSTIAMVTPWTWAIVALALFIAGTEIRVHAEDGLLASRFGPAFDAYKRKVAAYIPFVR